MDEIDQTISFQEGQPCPLPIEGHGGGLSFSSNGEMLLIAAVSHPSETQIKAFDGEWKAKLVAESEFPSIPIFAIGGEDWLLETPCNPAQQEKEAPGFIEALYAKEDYNFFVSKNHKCCSIYCYYPMRWDYRSHSVHDGFD